MVAKPEIKSQELAHRYGRPLSTIQRRRAKIERGLLIRRYEIDFSRLRSRQSDLMIAVGHGDTEETARSLLELYADNILSISVRIGNPEVNLMAHIFYSGTEELHRIIEGVKAVPSVKSVDWSELVKVVASSGKTDGQAKIIDRIFQNGHDRG